MKKSILILILILSTIHLFGQNPKGVVLDKETLEPIANVNIYLKSKKKGAVSNDKGEFDLKFDSTANESDSIYFSIIGYKTRILNLSELKENNFIVHLSKMVVQLKEATIISNIKLKPEIHFDKLLSLKIGLHSFGTILIEGKIYTVGGDASYLEDNEKKAFIEIQNDDPSFGDLIKAIKLNSTWEYYQGTLQIYDIETDTWTTSNLKLRKRAYHTLNYFNNKLYVLGGKNLSNSGKKEYLDDKIEVIDLKNDSVVVDNTNPHQAVNPASFVNDNKIIIMGGSIEVNSIGNKIYTKKSHLYDIETGFWYELNDMTKAKEVKGVLIENTIYLIGGFEDKPLKEIETYTLSTGKWKYEGDLFDGIEKPALTYHDNLIYIFNGYKILTYNIELKVLNEYKIDLDLISSELYYYNDKLYILGGYRENEYSKTPSPDLYSIDLNEFSKTTISKSIHFAP